VNAYEVEAGIGVLQVTLCDPCPRWFFSTVSMPERLECEVLQKARYINTLTFTFIDRRHLQ